MKNMNSSVPSRQASRPGLMTDCVGSLFFGVFYFWTTSFGWNKVSCLAATTFSLPSSKSTFSQPFREKCINEVVRIGSVVIFHLNKL